MLLVYTSYRQIAEVEGHRGVCEGLPVVDPSTDVQDRQLICPAIFPHSQQHGCLDGCRLDCAILHKYK